jgi:drug/metabolite transporter (DMT)-like permease
MTQPGIEPALRPCQQTASGLPEARQFLVGAGCAVTAVAIWAGWLVMMRLGVTTTLSAADLTALRFAIAGPVLLPVMIRRGLAIDRLGWRGFVAVVFGVGAPQVLIIGAGLLFAPVAHAGALYQGVLPLAVACLAAIVLKERVSVIRRIGLSLVVAGAFMIGGIGLSSLGGRQSIGHLLFLMAAGMWAGYTVAIRRARVDGLHAAAIAAVVSLIIYLPIYAAFIEDGLFKAPVADLAVQGLYQGILTAVVSLALYGRAIRVLGASNAAAFVALGPIMAALMAIPALGEWPSRADWIAIILIAIGVYLSIGGPIPRRIARAYS